MVIMVLDDNADMIELVKMMLDRIYDSESCRVIGGRHGLEGLDWLNTTEETPDIIISNIRMPQMDGLTFLRQVRLNTKWSQVHLVVMTALQSPDVWGEAAASGAEAFLSKPFSLDDLRDTLSRLSTN